LDIPKSSTIKTIVSFSLLFTVYTHGNAQNPTSKIAQTDSEKNYNNLRYKNIFRAMKCFRMKDTIGKTQYVTALLV
jgi:hypothetical protein